MRNFQGTVFIRTQTYREIFNFSLVYLEMEISHERCSKNFGYPKIKTGQISELITVTGQCKTKTEPLGLRNRMFSNIFYYY